MGGAHFNYEANFVVENRCCKISWFINIEIGRAHVELQSPVPISYAVFCLKKKKN